MSSIIQTVDGPNMDSASANSGPVIPAVAHDLATKFHNLRRRYGWYLVAKALAGGLAGVGLGWLALACLDYRLELPQSLRLTLAILVGLNALVWILVASLDIVRRASSLRFAMALEAEFESLGQRLRTLLELANGKLRAPAPMLSALAHQTLARWETIQPEQILPKKRLLINLCVLAIVAACLLVCGLPAGDMRIAMWRSAGWDLPYTTLVTTPGNLTLLEGLQPEVQCELHGRPNRQVSLRYRTADEEWIDAELNGTPAPDRKDTQVFRSKLDKLRADVEYQFVTSAGQTPIYTITMQPKIVLIESSVTVQPPAYTQLPERTFNSEEVSVLAGSKVLVTLQTNRALRSVALKVGSSNNEVIDVSASRHGDGSIWKFELPSVKNLTWQFTGLGEDDAPLAPVQGKLRIRQDEAPRLDWQAPADELIVNMLAEVPMNVLISDDYGLTHAGIAFQLGETDEFILKEWTLGQSPSEATTRESTAVVTRIRLDEILPLESFALSERDFVSYYAFADDNRDGAHQHAESEVRYLDIRPLKQLYSEQDLPPAGNGGRPRSFPLLEEIISRERYLYNRTRVISRHYNAENADQLRTLERMVETQSELANFTRFLIDFLISQGNDDNEALAQAEAVMLQASDALATAAFETAILREQEAIRLLVEAKNSADIALSKAPMAVRMQLSNLQRQLINRLRRKTPPADSKLADDLRQLASEQKQLAGRVSTWLKQTSSSAAASPTTQPSPPTQTETPTVESATDSDAAKPESSQVSIEDQFKADQQGLLDRLTALNSELAEKLKTSELASERLATAVLHMDALTGTSTRGQWQDFSSLAMPLSDELRELGEHAKALSDTDATKRIASLRDLTAELAGQEIEFTNRVDNTLVDKEPAADMKSDLQVRANAIIARTATVEDLLKIAPAGGDLRQGDILDQLEKLVATQSFHDRLQASAKSAKEYEQQSQKESWGVESRDRAKDHAYMAQLLDHLHRQLVAPRIEQLRQMEGKASQLANAIGSTITNSNSQNQTGQGVGLTLPPENKAGGGEQSDKQSEEKEIGQLKMELQSQLQSAGLEELAEMLELVKAIKATRRLVRRAVLLAATSAGWVALWQVSPAHLPMSA